MLHLYLDLIISSATTCSIAVSEDLCQTTDDQADLGTNLAPRNMGAILFMCSNHCIVYVYSFIVLIDANCVNENYTNCVHKNYMLYVKRTF